MGKRVFKFLGLAVFLGLLWALEASLIFASPVPWYWWNPVSVPSNNSLGASFSAQTHLSAHLANDNTALNVVNDGDLADTIYYPPDYSDSSAHNPPAQSTISMDYGDEAAGKRWQGSVSATAGEDTKEYTFFGYHFRVSGNDALDSGDYTHWNTYQRGDGFFKVTEPRILRITYGYSVNGTDSGTNQDRAKFTFIYDLYRYNPYNPENPVPDPGYDDIEEISSKTETHYVNAVNGPRGEEWVVTVTLDSGYWYKLQGITVSGYGNAYKGDSMEGDVYMKLALAPVPLPGSFWALFSGLVMLIGYKRKNPHNY